MAPIIIVENLSKSYLLRRANREQYITLRDALSSSARSAAAKVFRSLGLSWEPAAREHTLPSREEFWALQDVSFAVNQGTCLGIIGRNGAGKSTLLKLLSRITIPTRGRIVLRGRVASLLEVGTGFHPELTGRENIFLSGAIMGMTRLEIIKKFETIVAFAEIEKFLDTPVKRYSSGMYVRLAFAVAAHMEPEILVVDEVLAVGDAQFQRKCLGRMEEVGQSGRTVLFVSHNMGAISRLCSSCMVLDRGNLSYLGDVAVAIRMYNESTSTRVVRLARKPQEGTVITAFEVQHDESPLASPQPGIATSFFIDIESDSHIKNVDVALGINTMLGQRLVTLFSRFVDTHFDIKPGRNRIRCFVPMLSLKPDTYTVNIFVGTSYAVLDYIADPIEFEIGHFNCYPGITIPDLSQGSMLSYQEWSRQEIGA